MPRFTGADDLRGAEFVRADLRGARFVAADLSGVVMRGVEIPGADIDSPWLFDGEALHVNGVDVVPFVEAELNRRFPGRAERRATDPDGLRSAWAAIERTWEATLERVAGMPPGAVDVSVGGEWSFAKTLRHLVFATDMWLGRAILQAEQPFHPIGPLDNPFDSVPDSVPDSAPSSAPAGDTERDGPDQSAASAAAPSYDEVLEVRAGRIAMVRDFLATVTPELLASPRPNPHDAEHQETVLSCLHTILDEEWEHHRYAVRDLEAVTGSPSE
ncbi:MULTISPECIES: DinB family protein [Glycomyces]|uniref:DinB family protein n=2 Tax=Glycomyces TaxID=58113 RepID=A0A9X3PHH0_9ACTN|nr:DinB family protein [Glycomyces lechevalierae]MDA1383793.1 DinB family protein [Glycomyces lechevalierae]MDR7341214.1 hypothetical protein [Glycomyces lechevalierae]